MAFFRSYLQRAFFHRQRCSCLLQQGGLRQLAISTDPETRAQRTGYLEQLRRDLVPEAFDSRQAKKREQVVSKSKALDEREQKFTRSLVRDATKTLRENVISRFSPGGLHAQPYPPQLIVLDGVKGVGKSSIVQQTAAFARMQGFVVLYIPHPEDWTVFGKGFFAATAVEDRDPLFDGISAVRFYGRPNQLHEIFKVLLQLHEQDLEEISCQPEFATDTTADCNTLHDLVVLGKQLLDDVDTSWRQNPNLAGEVFHRLVKELCACREKPTAIIIDNYEYFVGLTYMTNERKERLHANSIRAIADHFGRDSIERTAGEMTNGFVLLATDPVHPFESWRCSRVRSGVDYPLSEHTLRDPSGEKWMADFKSRVRAQASGRQLLIDVPELSNSELRTLCSTFVHGGLRRLVDGDQRGTEADRLLALAGGRADLMKKIAVSR